jgi:hypothetical protein
MKKSKLDDFKPLYIGQLVDKACLYIATKLKINDSKINNFTANKKRFQIESKRNTKVDSKTLFDSSVGRALSLSHEGPWFKSCCGHLLV